MSDTSEKVAMAIRNERRFACAMDCKCDDRQLAEAAIAAMPKLSPKTREILMRGLAVVECEEQCAMPDSGREYWAAIGTARAELENLP